MGLFGSLFGSGTKNEDIKEMLKNGASVIDVRSAGEFQGGHVKGAKNIPLQNIDKHVEQIKKAGKPVVLCCASGMRSGQATSFLKAQGIECVNGGSWTSVRNLQQ